MATEKAYTPEQTASTLAAYAAGQTPEQIAFDIGRSARSVIAKLAKEGVYVSKAVTAGPKRLKKSELVACIAGYFDIDPVELESLEKATHQALERLHCSITNGKGHEAVTELDVVLTPAV